jgi:hypothetical protein
MREQDLNLLAVLARLLVGLRLSDVASNIPRRFMETARDLPPRCVRTAPGLQRAVAASRLAGVIDDGVGFSNVRSRAFEGAPLTTQRLALRAAIFVGLFVPLKVTAR